MFELLKNRPKEFRLFGLFTNEWHDKFPEELSIKILIKLSKKIFKELPMYFPKKLPWRFTNC